MQQALLNLIWDRASSCCEYCQLPQARSRRTFEVDHIIAQQHGGQTIESNLCLACYDCSKLKGPNIASINPLSGQMAALFNPRRQRWADQFRWIGAVLEGKTPAGRVTVFLLRINDPERLLLRRALIDEGVFPP